LKNARFMELGSFPQRVTRCRAIARVRTVIGRGFNQGREDRPHDEDHPPLDDRQPAIRRH
jgi:hypothetical protein